MARVEIDTDGYCTYPECPHAEVDVESTFNDNRCEALRDAPGATSQGYWCGVAQRYNTCPYGKV